MLKIASVVMCVMLMRSGSEVIQLFSFSTKLSITLIMLINVKKTVGILTFIRMINTT